MESNMTLNELREVYKQIDNYRGSLPNPLSDEVRNHFNAIQTMIHQDMINGQNARKEKQDEK